MTEVLVALIGTAGLVAVALISRPNKAIKRIDRRTRELEHNGGNSIKDDVYGLSLAVGHLQRHHDETRALLDEHLRRPQ